MTFANGVLMSVPSFLWTTTESTKHQKVEATSFDETYEVKKGNSFEKLHVMKKEKKKEHLRQPIVSHFRSEDISCVEKHYLPQNIKHLQSKKKVKRQHLEAMDYGVFLFNEAIYSSFF